MKTTKKAILGTVILAVVALAAVLVGKYLVDPSGSAIGKRTRRDSGKRMEQNLWKELSRYEETFLRNYFASLDKGQKSCLELIAGFNELAYSVTGHGGLWRQTVRNKYFGCGMNEHMTVCQQLKAAEKDFAQWDALQQKSMRISTERQACRFLRKHGNKMERYIRTYVPQDESFSSVRATPYFSQNLAGLLP